MRNDFLYKNISSRAVIFKKNRLEIIPSFSALSGQRSETLKINFHGRIIRHGGQHHNVYSVLLQLLCKSEQPVLRCPRLRWKILSKKQYPHFSFSENNSEYNFTICAVLASML